MSTNNFEDCLNCYNLWEKQMMDRFRQNINTYVEDKLKQAGEINYNNQNEILSLKGLLEATRNEISQNNNKVQSKIQRIRQLENQLNAQKQDEEELSKEILNYENLVKQLTLDNQKLSHENNYLRGQYGQNMGQSYYSSSRYYRR